MTATAGVVGGGTMGTGIAYVLAAAGHDVTVVEPDGTRATKLADVVREVAQDGVRRGKLDAARAAAVVERISVTSHVDDLDQDLDLVVETVPEGMDLKLDVLRAIAAKRPRLLASNTSALSIDDLAAALPDPGLFLGMHFFNPVWSIALVELVRGAVTTDAAISSAEQVVRLLGKQSIVVRNVPGFATSRLDVIASLEAMRMLEDGVATAEDIDRAAVLAYRHPVGPLRLSDIVGLDVRLDISRALTTTYGERYAPPSILIAKVEAGDLGQKSGRGFFDWPSGR